MSRARIAALLTVGALGVGAAPALGQSPGDSQYSDPLAGEQSGSGGSSGGSSGSGSGSSGSSGAPSSGAGTAGSGTAGSGAGGAGEGLSVTPPSTATAEPEAAPGAQAPAATASGRERLPDTGAELWVLAVVGGGLLLAGGALRLRTAAR